MSNPLANLIRRCLATITDDGGPVQRASVQVAGNDASDDVERWQQYGLSGHPQGQVQGLLVQANGTRFLIAADAMNDRPGGLAPGEVIVWSSHGQTIHFKADGKAYYTASEHIFDGPISVTGSMGSTGDIDTDGDVIASNVSLEHHVHDGVQPGGGVTGEPV